MPRHLTEAEARQAVEQVDLHEGNQTLAAHTLKMSRATLQSRLATAERVFKLKPKPKPEPTIVVPEPAQKREVHDSQFWKARAAELAAKLQIAEHAVEELAGIKDEQPTEHVLHVDGRFIEGGRATIGCLISDVHMGERIRREEVGGVNEFNPEICRQRLRRYWMAARIAGRRWTDDCHVDGVLLMLAGDLISGDIHEELMMTNALTSHEQVLACLEEFVFGVKELKAEFGKVHVVVVPGNHGRTTRKPTAKLYGKLSYDILIGNMLMRQFADDPDVTFQNDGAKDQVVQIYGKRLLVTHFDKIGTRGGMGFGGPMFPIIRGTKKILEQQASIGRRPDLICGGHYHTSGNPHGVFANGSVPGYSEYGDDLRAAVEPPQQWLFVLHDRWWVRERATIRLD